jgi:hypothetical protein
VAIARAISSRPLAAVREVAGLLLGEVVELEDLEQLAALPVYALLLLAMRGVRRTAVISVVACRQSNATLTLSRTDMLAKRRMFWNVRAMPRRVILPQRWPSIESPGRRSVRTSACTRR